MFVFFIFHLIPDYVNKAKKLPKPVYFAIFGAIGCLLGGILGEIFLYLTKKNPIIKQSAICLCIDTSGSMSQNGRMREAINSANKFVDRQDFKSVEIGLVEFDTNAQIKSKLTRSVADLHYQINKLEPGGATSMGLGIDESIKVLDNFKGEKFILLFTDGEPSDGDRSIIASQFAASKNIKLICVGTGDSQKSFLEKLASSPSMVFFTNSGQFEQAFLQAEKIIQNQQLLETDSGSYNYLESLFRVGIWTALLSAGTAIGLTIAQYLSTSSVLTSVSMNQANTFFQKTIVILKDLPWSKIRKILLSSFVAGIVAGVIGQILYSLFYFVPSGDRIFKLLGWAILGLILGWAMFLIIPNFDRKKGMIFGSTGAVVAGFLFLILAMVIGDVISRLVGATIFGAALGLCVGLVEIIYRQSWLTVALSPSNLIQVSLGEQPVLIGNSAMCTVCLPQGSNINLEYSLKDNKLLCLNKTTGTNFDHTPGSWKRFDKVAIGINTSSIKANTAELTSMF